MKLLVLCVATAVGLLASTSFASARPHDDGFGAAFERSSAVERFSDVPRARGRTAGRNGRAQRTSRASRTDRSSRLTSLNHVGSYGGVGPRPRQWCGWWMRTQLGGGPQFNLAWNWRHYGSPASAQVGAVVIWRHHVGIITGQASNGQWIVKSGNDGGAVRERARSVSGAIFRI